MEAFEPCQKNEGSRISPGGSACVDVSGVDRLMKARSIVQAGPSVMEPWEQ